MVAAENFWGSIAAQLGGDRVAVTDIIDNPAADPHDYEPTSDDARTMAGAQVAIVNGIGYDEWASKLLAARPDDSRVELDVGDLVGLQDGDNPHQWYSPDIVHAVIEAIVAAYRKPTRQRLLLRAQAASSRRGPGPVRPPDRRDQRATPAPRSAPRRASSTAGAGARPGAGHPGRAS